MPFPNRRLQLGELAELKQKRKQLKYEIDSAAKTICIEFEPMDSACDYTENINVDKLEIMMKAIKRKKTELDKVLEEISRLKGETGLSE